MKTIGDHISETDLASLYGCKPRYIRELSQKGVISKTAKGFPAWEALSAVIAHLKTAPASRADLAAEKLRKTSLEADALERQKQQAEGDLLTLAHWRHLLSETIPPIRQGMRTLLLTELPATLAGRTEADIRGICKKKYDALVRRLQAHEEKFEETAAT